MSFLHPDVSCKAKTTMRQLLTSALLFIILASCSSDTGKGNSNDRELVPYPEKYEHDGYSTLPDSAKPKFRPDTTIGQISLINSKNVDTYLGSNIMDKLIDHDLLQTTILSEDKKQQLTIYFHPGSAEKEFSEFKIEYKGDRPVGKVTIVKGDKFKTENGVELGISVGDLKSIKGEPDTVTTVGKKLAYHYQINDFTKSDFLRRYNMPIYYADYLFTNGYLTEFKFGFEYP